MDPFSSLDCYGYPTQNSLDQRTMDDEVRGLKQVREEGIPDLEEVETEQEECDHGENVPQERDTVDVNCNREEVIVEDVDEENEEEEETDSGIEIEQEAQIPSHTSVSIEVLRSQSAKQVKTNSQERAVGLREAKEVDTQFTIVCNAANEVSALLEASRKQCSSSSNELSAMKMLEHSASSHSASSRFLINSSRTKEESYETSSDLSDDPCKFSGSHQSTLDR